MRRSRRIQLKQDVQKFPNHKFNNEADEIIGAEFASKHIAPSEEANPKNATEKKKISAPGSRKRGASLQKIQANSSEISKRDLGIVNSLVVANNENDYGVTTVISDQKASKLEIIPSRNDSICAGKKVNFQLDLAKYLGEGKHSVMGISSELRKNFPFKEQLTQFKNKGKVNSHWPDAFTLQGKTLHSSAFSSLGTEITPAIQSDIAKNENYFDHSSNEDQINQNKEVDKLMKKSVLPDDLERREAAPKLFESAHSKKLKRKKIAEETAGNGWYNLPKPEMTDKMKKDIQIIKMRNTLDLKRHYKRNDSNKFPKYFQVGTVVEGAHEFYSSRISKKDRKATMVDELLADVEYRKKNKKKILEIQKMKMSGGKGHYRKTSQKRKPTWSRT